MAPRIVILLIAASLMCCIASDFDLIKLRTLSDLRGPSDGSLPPPPSADGTWRDIDYRSGCAIGRVEWPAVQHLDRTLAMARSCGVANATLAALDFWFKRDYRDEGCTDTESDRCCDMPDDTLWNSNWWWNRIGVPMRIGPICLLPCRRLRSWPHCPSAIRPTRPRAPSTKGWLPWPRIPSSRIVAGSESSARPCPGQAARHARDDRFLGETR